MLVPIFKKINYEEDFDVCVEIPLSKSGISKHENGFGWCVQFGPVVANALLEGDDWVDIKKYVLRDISGLKSMDKSDLEDIDNPLFQTEDEARVLAKKVLFSIRQFFTLLESRLQRELSKDEKELILLNLANTQNELKYKKRKNENEGCVL